MIDRLKDFLHGRLEELQYCITNPQGDEREAHDCTIAAEAYGKVLNFIKSQEQSDEFLDDLYLEQLEQMG